MLPQDIAEQILTIGCQYRNPKGGIAQVIYNYEKYVFPQFKHIINSGEGDKIAKLARALSGWLQMALRLLFDKKIKIVHIHTASYNSFRRSAYFVKLAKQFGKKVVIHIHGGGFKEYFATNPGWIASVLNSCDAIIALSPSWEQYYRSITSGVKIDIVENIVPPPEKPEMMQKNGLFHLLFLGGINEQKGVFDLVDALHEHKAEVQGKLILHIGGNGKIGELQSRINNYGLSKMVVYEGFVSGAKKSFLLFNCDAFMLPSYIEGLPVSILEAMSYGKPILATPVGGIPEIVKEKENGLLFKPGDKIKMYEAISLLMDNPTLSSNMGKSSEAKSKSYLPDNVSHSLFKLYGNL